jgi:hypothetical protein
LRAQPAPDRDQLLKQWHTVYVKLSRTVGALKFMEEGYRPPIPKKKKSKGAKGGSTKTIVGVVVIAAAAAAVWYFFFR